LAAEREVPFDPDRRRLLRDGERFGPKATLEVRALGRVTIASGKVAAGDPLSDLPPPLPRRVPRGEHGVTASLVTMVVGRRSVIRCAAATLHFAKGAVATWASAGSYGVDSGTGAFMDAKTEVTENDRDVIVKAMQKTRKSGFGYASQPSLVAFTSGLGDGAYASYWGFSRAKKLLVLMTDFAVLDRAQW